MKENHATIIPFPPAGETDNTSDEVLIQRCADGDARALAALFDRHHAVVYRYLSGLAGVDWPVVDDLVQDTFLEVNRSASRFRGDAKVRTWLLGIATNIARHHVRAESRLRARLRRVFNTPRETMSHSPYITMERTQQIEQLRIAMAALSPQAREAFVLCDVEGERGVDAAKILGIPEGTLYRRLHTARRKLRLSMQGVER